LQSALRVSCFLILAAGSTSAHKAFAWGAVGHSMIAEVASQLATSGSSFWNTNKELLGQLANVPDVMWKQSDTVSQERPNHWFQIDNYVTNPVQFPQALYSYANAVAQHQLPFVTENGTAPWRSEQFYLLGLAALKNNDDVKALQMAGALAHYIGDVSQPLHVTRNFDGPAPSKNGIHKFFETDNLNVVDRGQLQDSVAQKTKLMLADSAFVSTYDQGLVAGTFQEIIRAASHTQNILDIDSQFGRNEEGSKQQLTLAQQRLADGAASLSIVLSHMWKDSGRADSGKKVSAPAPSFVPADFSHTSKLWDSTGQQDSPASFNEDCGNSNRGLEFHSLSN